MSLTGIINMLIDIGLKVIPFLGTIAFLAFVLGVARFIKSSGSGEDVKKNKGLLIWGIIGLFVLVTIWGIISFLKSEFGFNNSMGIPQIEIR